MLRLDIAGLDSIEVCVTLGRVTAAFKGPADAPLQRSSGDGTNPIPERSRRRASRCFSAVFSAGGSRRG